MVVWPDDRKLRSTAVWTWIADTWADACQPGVDAPDPERYSTIAGSLLCLLQSSGCVIFTTTPNPPIVCLDDLDVPLLGCLLRG